ncbi:bifunctional 3-(3-hydroxy-phenyl)propionate/3-hydroxycinnamic acid hydroxylase [Azospirillum sp. YIM B02556]|uniref:Bifunctional 3-(3-hydroxy-phenyl)propionate/3-hydroxycinnamic acid hydroxylase n=1 Tax=Azospirillum endophyticum TaxID=2800326 RepID=A0ABS1F5V6_9PROT|nr:bifunctional 3-(3-hydroxy-phenyl)propionate/3-hydroxycinnamic acid hydroxylase [Azospirillum endophyticum]MBK1838830.1 bifunctional 3-(3-hydroxy-phenyl)propionate/3-hydroxycinnamic acid hydroxylase [Azospirillum endophyticum]
MPQTYDIAIVGYGPVGATLANLLGPSGLSICVIERDPEQFALPRAGHFDDEVMRVWQTAGVCDEIAATVRVNPGMRFVNAGGALLVDWPRPAGEGMQAWSTSYRFHQPYVEHVLRRGVERFGTVDVRLGTEVVSAEDQGDQVRLEVRSSSGGSESLQASYVVGCDGGRSTIRRAMGVGSIDLGSHEKWLVVDLELETEREDLGDFTIQYCDPLRPTTYIRMVGNRRRWEFMLMPGDDPAQIAQPEHVWRLLERWIGPSEARIERAVVYTFHAIVAERWRKGRLLLAGDAAHQTPPFLGQGMCAGIRDVSNLAWKLSSVVRGEAPDSLLDSYEQERAPHVRHYIDLAIRLGGILQTTDATRAEERDRMLGTAPERLISEKPRLGPSALTVGERPVGVLSEQVRAADGRRFDDLVGYRFAVLVSQSFMKELPVSTIGALARSNVAVVQDCGEGYLLRLGAKAVVLRPDRYILGTANGIAEIEALLPRIPCPSTAEQAA